MAFATAALLALGIANIFFILGQSPVVDERLRLADEGGEWRMRGGGLLYEKSAYLRERSVDFLIRAADEDAAGDALATARVARDAARASVEAGPADPSAWLLLSWSQMLLGNDTAALQALERSWSLAPQSLALASDRLLLAETLGLLNASDVDPALLAAVKRDVVLLKSADPNAFEAVSKLLPTLLARLEALEDST